MRNDKDYLSMKLWIKKEKFLKYPIQQSFLECHFMLFAVVVEQAGTDILFI
jgi:hypothetical protein